MDIGSLAAMNAEALVISMNESASARMISGAPTADKPSSARAATGENISTKAQILSIGRTLAVTADTRDIRLLCATPGIGISE